MGSQQNAHNNIDIVVFWLPGIRSRLEQSSLVPGLLYIAFFGVARRGHVVGDL